MEGIRYEAYADALAAAYDAVQRVRPKPTDDQSFHIEPDETFKIEAYDEPCPVCAKVTAD
jgi:hypothetical protein